jgi:thiol:disulfide interchange protein
MQRKLWCLLAGILLAGAGPVPAREDIRWERDYAGAVRRARATRKPLLVNFYADWCGPCKRLEATTLRDPAVVRLARGYVAVRLDRDVKQNRALADRLGSPGIPYTVILTPQGQKVSSSAGYADAREFSEFLRRGLSR